MHIDAKVIAKTRDKERANDSARARVELSRGAMATAGAAIAAVGLWSAACIVGGVISAGGPIAFVKSWFSAVAGF